MQRRNFMTLLASAATALPFVARAQQAAIPTVGILSGLPSSYITSGMPPFRQGLNESGYIEGRNVAIEYRLAEGHNDRLPSLVADLVDH